MLLNDLVTDALDRLDDAAHAVTDGPPPVWSRLELGRYGRDGYDVFARQTKCIFDIVVIPNRPLTGGYGSDLQRYLASQTPGMGLHDRRILFTQPNERDKIDAPVSAGDALPITATVTSQATTASGVPGGRLPDGVVAVLRVAWDRQTLPQESPQTLRRMDPTFETRQGDPQVWLWGEDGLMSIRVWPVATGNASYATVNGSWGTLVQIEGDSTATIDLGGWGGYGLYRGSSDAFPSGGPHGTVTQIHPDAANIKVDVARLGREPSVYPLELPRVFLKYVVFYAMAQALKREGPGQDLKLAQHYLDRFELGIRRMQERIRGILPEKRGMIGGGTTPESRGELRISLPAWWGYSRPVRW